MAMFEGWTLCPRCGNQLTHRANLVECATCDFLLYAHSALTANALPEDDGGRLLLARRAFEPWQGCWDILGGFLWEGEHPLDGLRRELREETTIEFEPERYFGAWTGQYEGRATLNLFWTGRLGAGEPEPNDDVAELRWFAAEALPPDDELAFDGLIADVLSAWRNDHA